MQDSALFNRVKTQISVSLQNDALKYFIRVAILPDRISCPVHDMHTTCTSAIFLQTCFEKTAATLPNESTVKGYFWFSFELFTGGTKNGREEWNSTPHKCSCAHSDFNVYPCSFRKTNFIGN